MLFAADVAEMPADQVVRSYWAELGEADLDATARDFATRLASRTLANLELLDERIRSRAEHWRISRMAVVDRNILRLAVYEFLYEPTPRTVAINEALEIARGLIEIRLSQFSPIGLDHERRSHFGNISRKEHLQGTFTCLTSRTHKELPTTDINFND